MTHLVENAMLFHWAKCWSCDKDHALFIGRLYVGYISKWGYGPYRSCAPWGAWMVDADNNGNIGLFETEAKAMSALENAVRRAMTIVSSDKPKCDRVDTDR